MHDFMLVGILVRFYDIYTADTERRVSAGNNNESSVVGTDTWKSRSEPEDAIGYT